MKNKINKKEQRIRGTAYAITALAVSLMAIAGIAIANSLNDELSLLDQELNNAGYSWLVDYSGEDLKSKIEVYEKDGNEIIALFEGINEDKEYKIYLSNLTREGGQDSFDLLVKGGRI